MCKWNANHISKFHYNPTVNESGIVVLLRKFWVSTRKEKAMMQRVFLLTQTFFLIPNSENVRKCVPNLVLKFHNDPTENESKIIIFLIQVWWYAEKWEDFGRRRRENEIERKRRRREYRQSENCPKMPLFIDRVLIIYYLLYLFLLLFYENELYFISYQMNKLNIFFSSNHYFNTVISLYLFSYKNLTIF